MSAYIGDCTDAGSRAGTFSLMMGLMFGGIAVAPAISSFLVAKTGNLLVPFYICLGIHSAQTLYAGLLIPESLGRKEQQEARRLRKERKANDASKAEEEAREALNQEHGWEKAIWVRVKRFFKPVVAIFAPIALLGPRQKAGGGRDWSLPMVALSSALYGMLMVGCNTSWPTLVLLTSFQSVHILTQDAVCTAQIRLDGCRARQSSVSDGCRSHHGVACYHSSTFEAGPKAAS